MNKHKLLFRTLKVCMNVPKLFSGPFKSREASSTTERTIYVFGWGVADQQRACVLQQHPYFLYIFFYSDETSRVAWQ